MAELELPLMFRRLELLTDDKEQIEKLTHLYDEKNLSFEDLELILKTIKLRQL